jgi:hypothetical protein
MMITSGVRQVPSPEAGPEDGLMPPVVAAMDFPNR